MSDERNNQDQDERSWLSKIGQLFSSEPRSRKDLEDVLSVAADNEVIDEDARSIIQGAMQVADMQARDIMIPRAQMVVIKSESTLEEILPQIIRSAHSRYPVIGDNPDDILGILLAKDLLPQILKKDNADFDIRELLRQTVVVPESKRLNVLLREFRENRNHMAIVIDEYGGVAGLVTIEDVLEEIVGEIEDETDIEEDQHIRRISDDEFFIKALTPIEDFNDYFKTDFSDEEFDTIGGLVIHAFGHMPARNETTRIDDFEFKIINADQRKIHSLRMRPIRD
ncbi:HlyC/CorC family transporter [Chromatocurvus halotolerans]|uniref:Magnesium and cobalt efflux protein CorC n=1 Tax=Chromatocurvus halotolerans TaxID=1132028 RepID=A0A4R2KJP3_9GAMM|nr:transporter associated domain-containing protein [Chromatocurvus halotolerans]TCO70228.1 magnesium and cobalt transporter [Chromatocurvus halotolerans]